MLPTPPGFVNNCQYFLISGNYLEGTYRKAFLVCKSGHYCHPRWMGSGEELRVVTEKCHAVGFVPPLPNPLPHGLPCLSQLYLQICPNRSCPTIVLHLQPFHVVCYLFLPFPPSASFYKRIFNWWAVLLCNYLR